MIISRTVLIQNTLDVAAQKHFSVLPIEDKLNWKQITQKFSKMFDSEGNKRKSNKCNPSIITIDKTPHLELSLEEYLEIEESLIVMHKIDIAVLIAAADKKRNNYSRSIR